MLRGYPIGGCGMPGILMPAPCATFMGCTLGFMGGPVKPPPLDAISEIHKWSSLYKSRKSYCFTPQKRNKQKRSLSLPVEPVPREKRQWRDLFGGLTDVRVRFRAPKLGLRFDRKEPAVNKKASSASHASDRSPDALSFRGSASLLDYDRLFSMPTTRGRVLFVSRSPPSEVSALLAVLKPFHADSNQVTNKISVGVKTNRL